MRRYFFLMMMFCCSVVPLTIATSAYAGSSEESAFSSFEDDEDEKKSKKKKDKDKDKETIKLDTTFLIAIAANLLTVLIIVGLIYYPNYHKVEILFTYFAFNIIIFLLTFVMNQVKISMGAAFGLFAVFSMLRYRTEGISMKDMTYLFIVIAVGLICATQLDVIVLSIICGSIILVTFLLDGNVLFKRQFSKMVLYENIHMIKPENQTALIEDLKSRTGLNIYKVSVNKIDFLRDVAQIEIFYHA